MTANKCDRCGMLYERECTPDIRINIYNHPYGDEWVDLCPKCQEKLEQFVANCRQEKSEKKMKNCKTCAHHHEVEKVKLFPSGDKRTFLGVVDGYVCTARIDFDDKVEWRVGIDDNEYCCDRYIPKNEKESADTIIGGCK